MRRTPALIVGGGPAGAAAAITLARAGVPHLLLERTREPGDALCGGFLSWRTLDTLEGLGIERETLNSADVTQLRLFTATRTVVAPLPHPAKAVSRRRLDTITLAAAASAGSTIERGVTVRAIEQRSARLADGASIDADALLLANGKHDVRGIARDTGPIKDPALGLRVRLAPSPRLTRLVGDAIELHLFDGGYAGVVRQEDGGANLCMAIRRSRLHAAGNPHRLLAALAGEMPSLGARLDALDNRIPIDAVANVPYGWRATRTEAGVFRLGDQAGVIPSLAGEGIGIAAASGIAAAIALARDGPASAAPWQAAFARSLARPIGIATLVWRLAEQRLGRAALMAAARTAPGLIEIIASATRIDHRR